MLLETKNIRKSPARKWQEEHLVIGGEREKIGTERGREEVGRTRDLEMKDEEEEQEGMRRKKEEVKETSTST
jgi:hypothetical protein